MIELKDLEKTYGTGTVTTRVLRDISFHVAPNEYVAIMGASGTGKSTLMNILGCLDKPTAGSYHLDGVDMVNLDDDDLSHLRNEKIGFVFQQFHLLQRSTALRNVMLPMIYAHHYPEDAEDRADAALTAVGLEDRMDHLPGELSGGQQQRVAIARALVKQSTVLFADEPTGNLDKGTGEAVMDLLTGLKDDGLAIVMVTHDEDYARRADRVVRMADGAVLS
ncbi:MAG: ABC transporter ATP-binding protein [Patescibacteria group bacterium]|nr:ABC transporter ATP-binding protein [Patescibacteria group bacterium]